MFKRGFSDYYPEYFEENNNKELDYTDIFRPTQDIDLVVDGSMDEITDLQNSLQNKFPHLKGNKTKLDIRSLKEAYNDKTALLNDFNFLNQHSDSHSVGMIALNPTNKEQSIKDLLNWSEENPQFLKDLLSNKIQYYYNPSHKKTSRYKEDKNPEIFSVIRYYIKMFQHELTAYPQDEKKIKEIIKNTNWTEANDNSYTSHWLKKNVPKLFLHAKNVEYAWNTLEEIGLRKKLLQIGDINEVESPSWWMNKEPLRSFKLGQGSGETAKELGIKTLAHDTSDFFIWTVITRSRKGEPNVFISRNDINGESAAFGEGFYASINQEKGQKSGFSIRFKLNPKATEGKDFTLKNDMIIIRNRNSIKVIPESITVSSLKEYFEIIREGNFKEGDEGLLEKLRRKINNKHTNTSDTEIKEIISLLKKENNFQLWKIWFELKISIQYPEFVRAFIKKGNQNVFKFLAKYALPHFKDHPEFVRTLIKKGNQDVLLALAEYALHQFKDHPEFVRALIEKGDPTLYVFEVLAKYTLPHFKDHPEFVESLIREGDQDALEALDKYTLSKDHWQKNSRLIELSQGKEVTVENLQKGLKKESKNTCS